MIIVDVVRILTIIIVVLSPSFYYHNHLRTARLSYENLTQLLHVRYVQMTHVEPDEVYVNPTHKLAPGPTLPVCVPAREAENAANLDHDESQEERLKSLITRKKMYKH